MIKSVPAQSAATIGGLGEVRIDAINICTHRRLGKNYSVSPIIPNPLIYAKGEPVMSF